MIDYENQLIRYLKNKKVILVGPSENLMKENLGSFINKFDVVVRMNNSYPITKSLYKHLGNRTDVLYHTMGSFVTTLKYVSDKPIEMLVNQGIQFIVSKHHITESTKKRKRNVEQFIGLNKDRIKLAMCHKKFFMGLKSNLNGTDPNMSTFAITHLLKSQLKSLTVIGCDFYSAGYYPGYTVLPEYKLDIKKRYLVRVDGKKRKKPSHNLNYQLAYLYSLLKKDNRLILNQVLKDKIENYAKTMSISQKGDYHFKKSTLNRCLKYWSNPDNGRNNPEDYSKVDLKRSNFLCELIQRIGNKDSKILELGCNCGRNLNYLYEKEYKNLTGIEINKKAISLMNKIYPNLKNINIINSSIEDCIRNFKINEFDIVYSMAVLQHIHVDSNWIFTKIARIAFKYIITIEQNNRNYKYLFEKEKFKQIEELKCDHLDNYMKGYVARIFKKKSVDWENHNPQLYYIRNERSKYLLNLFNQFQINKKYKILELGCGNGRNLEHLYNQDYNNLTGIDICKNIDNDKFNIIKQDLNKLNINEKFNIVFSIGVLMHLDKNITLEISNICTDYIFIIENDRNYKFNNFEIIFEENTNSEFFCSSHKMITRVYKRFTFN